MASVSLQGIEKSYTHFQAVRSLDLDIRDGEFVVLLGPSGCGKTTTLNMIAGLDTPTGGQIRIDDRRVDQVPPHRRNVAMVFQSIALYPHMTVRENIGFPLRMQKLPAAEVRDKVERAAALLRVESMLDRKPYQLSGGQRQRVAIGRAVVRDPDLFLFDEPLSSLDAKLRTDMRVELKRLHRSLNATFIYVTHDQVEAMTLADRIAVMSGGNLLQFADPDTIYRRPATMEVADFIGNPGMNFLRGTLETHDGAPALRTAGGAYPLPAALAAAARGLPAGSEAAIGIRPEAMAPAPLAGDGLLLQGQVWAVEPVGSDQFVDVITAGEDGPRLRARLSPERRYEVGAPIALALPAARLYLFDAAGLRVHGGEEPRA
ncbi:ABC transporter ATP-binding protein [Achromobacter ruhlandii]|uniref:ABC transporter ATP-binding protein n=1 Tax=Achromobacter ruhlandii TaxID=72557 RepID=UPI001EEDCD07|nr:ABC transporter ATP-binding protein [Achromobacter ruhlandii]MCZ8398924.1 ABC transporter ATP-binding protein [Achromobacter ruhlandii]